MINWTINVALVVLLTSITGTILFGVWYTIGKILEITGFVNYIYILLNALLVFWLIPVSYLSIRKRNYAYWGGFMFRYTPGIKFACIAFGCIWLVGVTLQVIWYVVSNLRLYQRYRRMMPVDGEIYDYFDEVCEKLGIPQGKVDLVEDYRQTGPSICGMRKAYVVLPVREFTREQLQVIFLHELTHYKQKVQILKHFTELAKALHFFNPIMWVYADKIRYWGENACDYVVISYMGDVKAYFDVLFSVAVDDQRLQLLESRLFEKKSELRKRMDLMKRSYAMKKKSKLLAALVVLTMITVSTTSIHAATMAVGDQYYDTYFDTVEDMEIQNDPNIQVHEAYGFEPGVIVEEGVVDTRLRTMTSFTWNLAANRASRTPDFSAKSGGKIAVSATASNPSASIRVGIIRPDGVMQYISGTGSGSYTFSLTQTGKYGVYVQNMTGSAITVTGAYSY